MALETSLAPEELLNHTQRIELQQGRVRKADRFITQRSIDTIARAHDAGMKFAIAIPLLYPFLVPLGLHVPLYGRDLAAIRYAVCD